MKSASDFDFAQSDATASLGHGLASLSLTTSMSLL